MISSTVDVSQYHIVIGVRGDLRTFIMLAQDLIQMFSLQPLPREGGFYRELYRSDEQIAQEVLPERFGGSRPFGTHILYLLTNEQFSAFHRLKSDEVYSFYTGDPIELFQLQPDGNLLTTIMGNNLAAGHSLTTVVSRHNWQASRVSGQGEFALLGCTVMPGFTFDDYEHGDWENLLRQYPRQHELIMRLTHK